MMNTYGVRSSFFFFIPATKPPGRGGRSPFLPQDAPHGRAEGSPRGRTHRWRSGPRRTRRPREAPPSSPPSWPGKAASGCRSAGPRRAPRSPAGCGRTFLCVCISRKRKGEGGGKIKINERYQLTAGFRRILNMQVNPAGFFERGVDLGLRREARDEPWAELISRRM